MPTIAITGASGHLGGAIITELLKDEQYIIRGHFFSQSPPIKNNNLSWIKGDLTPDDLSILIKGADYVIHCAAIISITGDKDGSVYRTNVVGTEQVINICKQENIKRLIHISSTHALQEEPLDVEFNEKRPYKTKNDFAYDYTKATAEQLVLNATQSHELNAVILRPSSMIGPVDYKPSLLGAALFDIAKGKVPAMVNGGYDFVDIRDVSKSIIASLTKGVSGESYNLTGKYYPIKELARLTAEIAEVKPPKFTVPNWIVLLSMPFINLQSAITKKAPKFTKESITVLKYGHPNMSSHKAETVLNHSSRDVKETISDLLNWNKTFDRK